jgi:hypothetical protein
MQKLLMSAFCAGLLCIACRKQEPDANNDTKGDVILKMDNRVGIQELVLGTNPYTNAVSETFTVSAFDYFISNIRLRHSDGSWLTIPQDSSYFLVKEAVPTSQLLRLRNIPQGRYNAVEFVVGVDSLRSASPLQRRTGALDPGGSAEGMYWTWNSGYIFVKLEGKVSALPPDPVAGQSFWFHIGGFGGYNQPTMNNLKTIRLEFDPGETVDVREGQNRPSSAHLLIDVLKIMDGPTKVAFREHRSVMATPFAKNIAENYTKMFSFSHVENY